MSRIFWDIPDNIWANCILQLFREDIKFYDLDEILQTIGIIVQFRHYYCNLSINDNVHSYNILFSFRVCATLFMNRIEMLWLWVTNTKLLSFIPFVRCLSIILCNCVIISTNISQIEIFRFHKNFYNTKCLYEHLIIFIVILFLLELRQ